MKPFDPSAAAQEGSGIYGLPHTEDDARVVVVPVPFDATTSYRRGAAGGPAAVLRASRQVDLYDREVGRPYEAGIYLQPEATLLAALNEDGRAAADPILAAGGAEDGNAEHQHLLTRVNGISEAVNKWVYDATARLLDKGKMAVILGGDHAVPFGAIQAYAERHPGLGVLHIDAHADLRDAYEGFTYSHASVMHNVATRIPAVGRLVQVGIRDFSEDEARFAEASGGRIQTFYDVDLARGRFEGEPFARQVERIVAALPQEVYVSFDIDGLDPAFCPHTGTPVPGGLHFHEASYLVGAVVRSGRRIVGVDLNEVAPGPDGDDWDGNVGARLLYKLIGWALLSGR